MRIIATLLFGTIVVGCAKAPSPAAKAPTPAVVAETPAHRLFVEANACWFGGVWSDAERETPASMQATVDAHCREVLRRVYSGDDQTRLEQLRAFEHGVVADVANRISDLASRNADDRRLAETYSKLLLATAATQREATEARRAAVRVKRDLDHEREKLTDDEVSAVSPLTSTKELDALLAWDAPDLVPEARAVAYIAAMDHMALSRGLPKHLKIYALEGSMKALFGTNAPEVPSDAKTKLPSGTYLAYLTDVAKAAGHPVPPDAKTAKFQEPLAWSGALEGVGDKIAKNANDLSPNTELRDVSLRIADRLREWNEAEKHALEANERSPAPPPKKTAKKR